MTIPLADLKFGNPEIDAIRARKLNDLITHLRAAAAITSDPTIAALAGLTGAADKLAYFNGVDSVALADFPAFGRTLVANASAADARSDLGLGSLAVLNSVNDGNWSGADLEITNGGTGASSASAARANLGLGTMAVQTASAVAITGGTATLITTSAGAITRALKVSNLSDTAGTGAGLALSPHSSDTTVGAVDSIVVGAGDYRVSIKAFHGGSLQEIATFGASGIDVTGETRCDSLRIDAAPAAAASVLSTHKAAVNFNGTTYYVLLSNV